MTPAPSLVRLLCDVRSTLQYLKDNGCRGFDCSEAGLRTLARMRDFRKMDVPGAQRKTTRWSIEAYEQYEAPDLGVEEMGS